MVNAEARFKQLWEDFGPRVRAKLSSQRRTDAAVSPEDIEQEVYIRLWQSLVREKNIENPASYIFRIVNTTIIDAVRRANARESSRRTEFEVAELSDIDGSEPEARLERQQVLDALDSDWVSLSEDRALAVKLHLQGFTPGEIGKLTQWTEGRARNLVYRGLAQIREKLAQNQDAGGNHD